MKYISAMASVWLVSLVLGLGAMEARAEFKETYTKATFETALNDGKHVVVEVFKHGCGTCKAQQPALQEAKKDYPNAVFLAVDFASNDKAVARFKVIKQSTIIVFKDGDEVARLVGETAKDKILGAIAKGA